MPVAKPSKQPDRAKPVLFAPGALYGYCPRCGAPGIRRKSGGKEGDYEGVGPQRDYCQDGHNYPSIEATERPTPKPSKRTK